MHSPETIHTTGQGDSQSHSPTHLERVTGAGKLGSRGQAIELLADVDEATEGGRGSHPHDIVQINRGHLETR